MQLLVLLALALGMLTFVSILSIPLFLPGLDNISTLVMMVVQALTQVLSFVVPVLLMVYIYYRGQQREFLRCDFTGRKWLLGLVGMIIMVLMVPVNDWLTVWNSGWNLGAMGEIMRSIQDVTEGLVEDMLSGTSVGRLLANLLVVALVPAVCEELFFRGGIQNLLVRWISGDGRRGWGVHVGIWLSAIIFSLGHGEIFSFMPRVLMGAVLGYLYVYSGSLLPNMLAHFANNALVVVLYWLSSRGVVDIDPNAPLQFGVLLTVCCTLAAVALFYVTFTKKLKTNR